MQFEPQVNHHHVDSRRAERMYLPGMMGGPSRINVSVRTKDSPSFFDEPFHCSKADDADHHPVKPQHEQAEPSVTKATDDRR